MSLKPRGVLGGCQTFGVPDYEDVGQGNGKLARVWQNPGKGLHPCGLGLPIPTPPSSSQPGILQGCSRLPCVDIPDHHTTLCIPCSHPVKHVCSSCLACECCLLILSNFGNQIRLQPKLIAGLRASREACLGSCAASMGQTQSFPGGLRERIIEILSLASAA